MTLAYMHLDGCGKPAFYLTRQPVFGEPIDADIARHLDGRRMLAAETILCDTCRRAIAELHPEYIREL